ncbi:FMN-binding negative transcriptional regulator [Stenotrophomonas sp. HITSZ_GD]|uniref:FMN-binding negative transcriptional regulator n=1 Tax=Stenotrophomonas sp. HITSZ_GD TaxID=3037248 RepID=UPI00240DD5AE|nr:FMN-binding negative transcriptional regulator [Stenotrophomonas sp. HITSZ_GD]MDG2526643.1 FMN-binding negative transcriptional regulator [Stenotrophomonas sp. HITSZ_GD]
MYTPRAFVETDLAALDGLIAHDPFVTVVTLAEGVPEASHLPVLYRRDGEAVVLEGHWARPNPQASGGPALVIVQGPHAYVSASWYPDKAQAARVPTWNYATAHLHGRLEPFHDEEALADLVDRLSRHFEARAGGDWRFDPADPRERSQLRGIVGFRFVAERIEMKFKLSQNHPAANVAAVIAALERQDTDQTRATAALMRDRTAATVQGAEG